MKELIIILVILLFAVYGLIQGARKTLINIMKLIQGFKNKNNNIERGQNDACNPADTVLDKTITNAMLTGVLDEVIAVIPTVLPVVITFMAIRKGISFVIGMLRSA